MIFDFGALSERDRHKLLIATVVPRPIAWITTLNIDGSVNVGPYSFFGVACAEPPLVSIGIGAGERDGDCDAKDTGVNIRRAGEFVVNLVNTANARAMVTTAVNFPQGVSELDQAGLHATASEKVRAPRIAESPVSLECRTYKLIDLPAGHSLVLGEVISAHICDDVIMDAERCYIDTPRLDLIARMHGSGWYARSGEWFQIITPNFGGGCG
jgi:flavin reductase (DIM6/NTAB) family NADH-FMN oxidoreductase RutF